jgi:hypothetical protein
MAQGVGPEFKPQYTHTHTHTHTHTKIWKGKEELFLAGVMDVLTLDYGDGCWYPHISKHITMDSLNVHSLLYVSYNSINLFYILKQKQPMSAV